MANDVNLKAKKEEWPKSRSVLAEYGLASLEDARDLCLSKGIDVDKIVKGVQPIAFENAVLGLHAGRGHRAEKRRHCRRRGCRGHRHGPAGVLHSRFCR